MESEGGGSSSLKKREAAAQACETCRARKTKCDEQRPRCGLCQRLNATCEYREPKPTKKDKTLENILATVTAIERKLDQSNIYRDNPPGLRETSASTSYSLSQIPSRTKESAYSTFQIPASSAAEGHKILSWPAVRTLLQRDVAHLEDWDGFGAPSESWLVRITDDLDNPLPVDERVDITVDAADNFSSKNLIKLEQEIVQDLCTAYFYTFHRTYPVIDHDSFYSDILPKAFQTSFAEDEDASALVLLVLALGSVAQEGTIGNPLCEETNGRKTGLRGGSFSRPPGTLFVNEAQRRLGISLTRFNLTVLQSHILLAIYFSQCSKNLEYWRMTELTCTICRTLVKLLGTQSQTNELSNTRSSTLNWGSVEADLLSRCFWMCVLLESGPTSELGLIATGITELQDSVPLPLFITKANDWAKMPEELFIEYHFLAHITLRTLLNRIFESLGSYRSPFNEDPNSNIPPENVIQELTDQLQRWRDHLPLAISWTDEDAIERENLHPKSIMLKIDGTRYKYALYLINRPHIYKALHNPNSLTVLDLNRCEIAIRACTVWPLTLPTLQCNKRLLPHLYEYSHTFFGILILFHVCSYSQSLKPILNRPENRELVDNSIAMYLEWLRDLQVVHPVAHWSWKLVQQIYKDHPVVNM